MSRTARHGALPTILAVLLLSASGAAAATGIEGSVYTNDELGFTIGLPQELVDVGWKAFPGEPGLSYVVFEGPQIETITVYVEELLEPVPLDDFLDISLFIFPLVFDDWVAESTLLLEVNGREAYEVIYTTTIAEIDTRAVEYMFVTDTHSFTMSGLFLGDPFPFPLNEFRSILSTFVIGAATAVEPAGSALTTWGRLRGRR